MKKFLLISSWAPPMAGGSAVILRQLLNTFPEGSYAVLTDRLSAFHGLPADGWLRAPHYFLNDARRRTVEEAAAIASFGVAPGPIGSLVRRAVRPVTDLAEVKTMALEVTRSAMQTIGEENPDIILAVSGDPVFLVAAAQAAHAGGRRLFVHLFDLLAGNKYSPPRRNLASRTEGAVLRAAERVFVPNPAMADYYRARLGISPVVIPNGTEIQPFKTARPISHPPTILYTGAVYWAQRDALNNLVAALRQLPDVRFEARTRASTYELKRAGLRTEHVMAFGSQKEALEAQRTADILFLPLAFHTSAQDVIRTAFPAKAAEYLVSGTPILVHAPADAYISRYAREAGWGCVVDVLEPDALTHAVRRLLSESRLRAELVASAHAEALRTHDLRQIAHEYQTYFH